MWRSTFGLLLVLLVAQAGLAEERFITQEVNSRFLNGSNSRFGHIAAKVGCCATHHGWKRDVGGRAGERLVTGWRVLEPAGRGVLEA
jgi:hypothetical protein